MNKKNLYAPALQALWVGSTSLQTGAVADLVDLLASLLRDQSR